MRVRFAADVLDDPRSWDILDRIVHHFLDQRHLWDIEDPTLIEESRWIQSDMGGRTGRRNVDALRKCYTYSVYPRRNMMLLSCTLFRLKRPFLVTLNWTKSDEVS